MTVDGPGGRLSCCIHIACIPGRTFSASLEACMMCSPRSMLYGWSRVEYYHVFPIVVVAETLDYSF